MAAPTTLLDFRKAEFDRLKLALSDARTPLADAVTAEAAAIAKFTLKSNLLREAREAVDASRKELAGIPMPADGDPLLKDMRDAMVALREAAVEQVGADRERRRLGMERQALGDRAKILAARFAEAEKVRDAEEEATKQRIAWLAAATSAPLKDLPDQADLALKAFQTNASNKVEADFPTNADDEKKILTRVRARRTLGADALKEAGAIADGALAVSVTWDEATTRESAKTPALQRAFEAAIAALRAFINAPSRLEPARAALKALAERLASPVTDAQHKEIFATTDAALKTRREDALAKLKARDEASVALSKAQVDYDTALFAAQAADPDKTEDQLNNADPALKALRKAAAKDMVKALADKEAALDPDRSVLEEWFAAVPDALWDQLDALDAATAQLGAIKAAVPADLANAVKDAEKALAQNLDAASRELRKVEQLRDALAQRQSELADELDLLPRNRQAAARFVAAV